MKNSNRFYISFNVNSIKIRKLFRRHRDKMHFIFQIEIVTVINEENSQLRKHKIQKVKLTNF